MTTDPEDIAKMNELAQYLEQHKSEIPNCDKLVQKLQGNQQEGHLVHAEFVKKFYDNGTYQITDIEVKDGTHDIDIQLNGTINVQVWHGQSTAGHIIERVFDPDEKKRQISLGNVSPLGGVKTDWDHDEQVLFRKLNQLPNDRLGIVLLHERFTGFTLLPDWMPKIPENKCVIKFLNEVHDWKIYGVAIVYHSDCFQHLEEIKKIIDSLGYNFKGENIP